MNSHTDAEAIAEFLGYHRMALDRDNVLRRQGDIWARNLLGDLVYDDPSRCWSLIRAISLRQPSDDALVFLGVLLGALLREQPKFISEVAADVKANPELAQVMSWVTEDEHMDQSVWAQIEALSSSPGAQK